METVRVAHPDEPGAVMIINAGDFDPAMYTLCEGETAPVRIEPPVTEAEMLKEALDLVIAAHDDVQSELARMQDELTNEREDGDRARSWARENEARVVELREQLAGAQRDVVSLREGNEALGKQVQELLAEKAARDAQAPAGSGSAKRGR